MLKDSRQQQKGQTVVSTENLWYKLYHRLKYDVVQEPYQIYGINLMLNKERDKIFASPKFARQDF